MASIVMMVDNGIANNKVANCQLQYSITCHHISMFILMFHDMFTLRLNHCHKFI